MLIRHLDFFITLAEEGHFGRAAELCGVSQPALSLAIGKLEEDLGSTLILRGKRFMGVTAEGEKVLLWGRQILADYGHLRDDLSGRRRGGLTGSLRLGVTACAVGLIPAISQAFEARNPLARIEIRLLSAAAISEGIEHFDLDGGLTEAGGRARAGIEARPVATGPMLFACRADHPFAPDPQVAWDDAATQPLCVPAGPVAEYLRSRRLRPAITCDSLDLVLAHLRAGEWCAIVPPAFRALLGPGDDIALCDLDGGGLPLRHVLVTKRRDPPAPMVQALLATVAAIEAGGGDRAA